MAYIRKTDDNSANAILSGNAGKIEYKLDDANDSLRLSFTSGGSDLRLNAVTGIDAEIDLAEILESIPLKTVPVNAGSLIEVDSVTISRFRNNPGIQIDSLQESLYFNVIKGHIFREGTRSGEYTNILTKRVLTQREQISITYKAFPELVSVFCDNTAGGATFSATITAYRNNGNVSSILLGSISPASGCYIWTVQAGYNSIRTLVSNPSNVTGWKITFSRSSTTIGWIRFNLGKVQYRARCFAFRNDLGGIDMIHSLGDFRCLPKYQPRVFVNDGHSKVLKSNPATEYEVESGPVVNAVQREKWKAFLRSREKYIWTLADQFGSTPEFVPIILTDASPKLTDWELNSVTFKFRPEYERGGRIYQHE